MTATNYSPPKVGYSRNMGDGSIDKEDDLWALYVNNISYNK